MDFSRNELNVTHYLTVNEIQLDKFSMEYSTVCVISKRL